MLSASNVSELLEATRVAIMKVFRAEKVDFLMIDKELAIQFKSDGGRTSKMYHAYSPFEVAIPKSFDLKKGTFSIKPAFKSLLDLKNRLDLHNNGKTCVWAVMNQEASNKYFLLIQISGE
jgi:hypothetical protein